MGLSKDYQRAYLKVTADSGVKKEIAQRIIERIVERTQSGIDKDGDKFKAYSKAYKKSLQFKIYGKTNKVNLTLTEAMLSSIGIAGTSGNTITIGFTDKEQFLKASGHIDGTGANNALPVRDFWGLPLSDVQKIIKEVIKDSNEDGLIEALNEASPTQLIIEEGDDG